MSGVKWLELKNIVRGEPVNSSVVALSVRGDKTDRLSAVHIEGFLRLFLTLYEHCMTGEVGSVECQSTHSVEGIR